MIEIIIAILLSIGINTDGSDIKIISDTTNKGGTEKVTFIDNTTGNTYSMVGTEQNGWGLVGNTSNSNGTEQNGWGVQ
jgi:hypothetical protein